MNAFAIFQQAERTLAQNPADEQAQFTVDLWNASKNLHTKNTRLEAQVASLKEELAVVNSANADYARNQDMLQTRLNSVSSGRSVNPVGPFDASAFMQSMFAATGNVAAAS